MAVQVYGCNHVAIEVDNAEKAVAFYADVFDLEMLRGSESSGWDLGCGREARKPIRERPFEGYFRGARRPKSLCLIHPGMNRDARRDIALSRCSVAGSPFQCSTTIASSI